MPTVNFYILNSDSERERQFFACKLAEKAFRSGFKSYILTDSSYQAEQLDRLLWTFRPNSFVPHALNNTPLPNSANAILIGEQTAPECWQHTVINLSQHCPEAMGASENIFELLDNDEARKQAGRLRYRQYKEQGFPPKTHKI